MTEKYLKALVHERGHAVPRTHDCRSLVLLLVPTDPTLTRFLRAAYALGQLAVGPRYPHPLVAPDASRSRSA